MTVCAACLARIKTWEGSDPDCAFDSGRPFIRNNWNCASLDLIRDAMPQFGNRHSRVDYRSDGDQSYATVDLSGIELESRSARTLWVSWYKNRGCTEAMWLLDEDDVPRLPVEDDIVAIANALRSEMGEGSSE